MQRPPPTQPPPLWIEIQTREQGIVGDRRAEGPRGWSGVFARTRWMLQRQGVQGANQGCRVTTAKYNTKHNFIRGG